MNRSAIRELAFKLIYSLEIQKQENLEEAKELYLESNEINDENAKKYITEAIYGIQDNKDEIIKIVKDENIKGKVPCIFSEEKPNNNDNNIVSSMMMVPATAGILAASYVINKIINT